MQARATAEGPESLTWLLPADFKDDKFERVGRTEEGEDQVERGIFPVEQARGQLHWLEAMHAAGLYKDELAYPHLKQMAFEFELPRAAYGEDRFGRAARIRELEYQRSGARAAHDRGLRADQRQWCNGMSRSARRRARRYLAELAKHPGVNVYWMGRSYLGENLWAADVMLPSPALLRSWAKETTLKASIVYSGRQHANEVSSTSHIVKLGEQLVNDPTRALLKQVNVVLHPITNPDGAELSVQLAEITPNNMLHPGYHGALAADVSTGQTDTDPVYPESRTRRQLLETLAAGCVSESARLSVA